MRRARAEALAAPLEVGEPAADEDDIEQRSSSTFLSLQRQDRQNIEDRKSSVRKK